LVAPSLRALCVLCTHAARRSRHTGKRAPRSRQERQSLSAQLLFSSSGADTKNGPTSVEPSTGPGTGKSSYATMRLATPQYL
jgi:hypothetical protein